MDNKLKRVFKVGTLTFLEILNNFKFGFNQVFFIVYMEHFGITILIVTSVPFPGMIETGL